MRTKPSEATRSVAIADLLGEEKLSHPHQAIMLLWYYETGENVREY
jgi:hypothetical protein